MNEFTKEELQGLRALCELHLRYNKDDKETIETNEKLTKLIDNYCDHPDCFELDTDSVILGCNNCNKVWYE